MNRSKNGEAAVGGAAAERASTGEPGAASANTDGAAGARASLGGAEGATASLGGSAGSRANIVAGRQLVGLLRPTECGHWYLTVDSDQALGGALLVDPALATSHVDALVDLVTAVRAANLPGVLPAADLVEQAGQVWLLTAAQPGPTVRELIDAGPGRGLDAGSAATLLNETAQTLGGLHRQDITHGAFGPSSIVVGADGKAALIDVGLAVATGLRTGSADDDIRSWGRLADTLSREWAAAGPAAEMLANAAAEGADGDLSAARDVLIDGRELLPADFLERRALATARTQWSDFMSDYARKAPPVSGSAPAFGSLLPAIAERVESVAASVSRAATADSGLRPADVDDPPAPATADPAREPRPGASPDPNLAPLFRPSGREPGSSQESRTDAVERQGGHGAATRTASALSPSSAPAASSAGGRSGDVGDRRLPAGPRRRVPLALILAGVAAVLSALAGVLWWLQRGDEPAAGLEIVNVSVQQPAAEPACNSRVEIVGVVETNGGEGEIHFRWVRNDGEASDVRRVPVLSGETRKELPLGWTFEGAGTYDATAILEIIEPVERSAQTTFTYTCEP